MKKVIIASKNPVKIEAARNGFSKMFPDESFEFEGVTVPSNVSDQPLTDKETFQGSLNRAKNAKEAIKADYWVGIEGGLEEKNSELEAFAWVVILSNEKIGKGRTSTFFLPKKIAELVKKGIELGEADDIVFSRSNSKQTKGAVGLLTNNVITRTSYYSEAIVLALIPFKNEKLY